MKKLTLILPLLIILLLFWGCYKEGPAISLRSKINRIKGRYEITKFYSNSNDSTIIFNNDKFTSSIGFVKAKGYNYHELVIFLNTNIDTNKTSSYYGYSFELIKNGNVMSWFSGGRGSIVNGDSLNLFDNNEIKWTIRRLTNDELFLETNIEDKDLRLELHKTKYYN